MSVAQKTKVSVPTVPTATNLVNKSIKPYDITEAVLQTIQPEKSVTNDSWADHLKIKDIYKDTAFIQTIDSSPLKVIDDF